MPFFVLGAWTTYTGSSRYQPFVSTAGNPFDRGRGVTGICFLAALSGADPDA